MERLRKSTKHMLLSSWGGLRTFEGKFLNHLMKANLNYSGYES